MYNLIHRKTRYENTIWTVEGFKLFKPINAPQVKQKVVYINVCLKLPTNSEGLIRSKNLMKSLQRVKLIIHLEQTLSLH